MQNYYSYICLPYFTSTELDNQTARAEFINENSKIGSNLLLKILFYFSVLYNII